MVAANSTVQKALDQINLASILLAMVAATVFFLTTIGWSHVVLIIVALILFRYELVNLNFILSLTLFYGISLLALQRYDLDKINELLMAQLLPVITFILFYFIISRRGWFLSVMNKLAYYANRTGKLMTKPLAPKYKKYFYIVVAIIFSYGTIFIFQGFFGVYGGLIVLFSGFHVARFLLTKQQQKIFLSIALLIYIAIYNLTLTRGLILLVEQPLTYVYIYLPTILIPVIFVIMYQWEYLRK